MENSLSLLAIAVSALLIAKTVLPQGAPMGAEDSEDDTQLFI